LTYLSDDEENSNIPAEPILSPAQRRHIVGKAQAYAFGKTVLRRFRAAWREEFIRRWELEDDAPIDLADIDARIIARPVKAVHEAAPDAIEPSIQERTPHSPRGPPCVLRTTDSNEGGVA
jgi:hypothetical protein